MERENVVAVVGLIGLATVGALLLLTTSGNPPLPGPAAPRPEGKAAKAAKVSPPAPRPELVTRGEVGDRPTPPEGAANLVLVVGCSMRRDAVGAYGGPPGVTPRIDALATRGARFDDVIAAGVWTRESVAAMLTGRHAIDLGLVERGPKAAALRLDSHHVTVAEALAARGWWTVAVNASPALTNSVTDVWQGVDHLQDAPVDGWKNELRLADADAVRRALSMLAERPGDRPFFLTLVLADSHKPVRVPPPESAKWSELPNPPYQATVARLDEAVGAIEADLEARGLLANTYLVVVADHGEGLDRPPHHGPAHGRLVAPSVARVPWVVAGPGVPAGRVVEGLASGVDVAPTLLGLMGVAGGLDAEAGLDLSGVIRGGSPRTARATAVTDTWYMTADRAAIWTSDRQCQHDFGSGPLKGETFDDACYDRRDDPDHGSPIQDPELMAKLLAWRQERAAPAAPETP